MADLTINFLIIGDLFDRYTILVNTLNNNTSVYCHECEMWVNDYDGDQLSTQSTEQFFEKITDDHDEQINGQRIEIRDSTERFI